jgi:hypothetical protein
MLICRRPEQPRRPSESRSRWWASFNSPRSQVLIRSTVMSFLAMSSRLRPVPQTQMVEPEFPIDAVTGAFLARPGVRQTASDVVNGFGASIAPGYESAPPAIDFAAASRNWCVVLGHVLPNEHACQGQRMCNQVMEASAKGVTVSSPNCQRMGPAASVIPSSPATRPAGTRRLTRCVSRWDCPDFS